MRAAISVLGQRTPALVELTLHVVGHAKRRRTSNVIFHCTWTHVVLLLRQPTEVGWVHDIWCTQTVDVLRWSQQAESRVGDFFGTEVGVRLCYARDMVYKWLQGYIHWRWSGGCNWFKHCFWFTFVFIDSYFCKRIFLLIRAQVLPTTYVTLC